MQKTNNQITNPAATPSVTITTITNEGETTHTITDQEAVTAIQEAYEDAKAYREDVLNDLVQRAIDKSIDEKYRRIIGNMSGFLADLSMRPSGAAYQGFTHNYHLAMSHLCKAVYEQAVKDFVELPNTIERLREDFHDRTAEHIHPYDFRYEPSYPIAD
ncbi:hypothetical protein [uncultured Selenomonas sp.]|uniref:hypothetical protein n=1 Tax=uncultured Selenomonas sp. TaxID=159275 RepID=UPI0028D8EB8A|nr:hypothetical protein [uncultured Selenomonas sp.]